MTLSPQEMHLLLALGVAFCFAVAALVLLGWGLFVGWVLGQVWGLIYRRIRRIYSLTAVSYWLDRMEREGRRTFEKAE